MPKICYKCHCEMSKRDMEITAGWGDYELVVKGIKVFACEKCNVVSISAENIKMLEDVSRGFSDRPKEERPYYLNVEETADLLKVSNQTVYNMIKDGRLKAIKFGREWRFNKRDIEKEIHN